MNVEFSQTAVIKQNLILSTAAEKLRDQHGLHVAQEWRLRQQREEAAAGRATRSLGGDGRRSEKEVCDKS